MADDYRYDVEGVPWVAVPTAQIDSWKRQIRTMRASITDLENTVMIYREARADSYSRDIARLIRENERLKSGDRSQWVTRPGVATGSSVWSVQVDIPIRSESVRYLTDEASKELQQLISDYSGRIVCSYLSYAARKIAEGNPSTMTPFSPFYW